MGFPLATGFHIEGFGVIIELPFVSISWFAVGMGVDGFCFPRRSRTEFLLFFWLRCSIDAGWVELGIAVIMVRPRGPVMVWFFL